MLETPPKFGSKPLGGKLAMPSDAKLAGAQQGFEGVILINMFLWFPFRGSSGSCQLVPQP